MKSDETTEKEKCPNCDSTFRNKKSLERHMEVLLTKDSAAQKCELCNFTSCTIFGLMSHKTNVHEGKNRDWPRFFDQVGHQTNASIGNNVCFIKIRSKLSSVSLLCLLQIFM